MDRFELRHNDFSLDEEQEAISSAARALLRNESPPRVVRAAEPMGYDAHLWTQLRDFGAVSIGVPARSGGAGGSFIDLMLVAEQVGAFTAPVPMISQAVVARLLVETGQPELLAGVLSGERPIALAPDSLDRPQLVPDAALVRDIIGLDRNGLMLLSLSEAPAHAPNQGNTPLAWVEPKGDRRLLVDGERAAQLHAQALTEWRLLMAAALVGLTDSALWSGVEFAKTRETMGVSIGSLQGVSFQLADVAIAVGGARNLVRKAAWMHEHMRGVRPELAAMAFATANRVATEGCYTAVHVQGGLGFTVEADVSLFFLRAKGWGALMGDPAREYEHVGDVLAARGRDDLTCGHTRQPIAVGARE